MFLLISSFPALAELGVTQNDLDALMAQVAARRWFDLATPDPDFSGFTVRPEDQLPGRPTEGKIEVARFFDHRLQLFVTKGQKAGPVNGSTIFDKLRQTNASVLGPNAGQFFFENQHLIPVKFRGKVALVFWGQIYRDSGGSRCVRYLYSDGGPWAWDYDWVGSDYWSANDCAVVLARKS